MKNLEETLLEILLSQLFIKKEINFASIQSARLLVDRYRERNEKPPRWIRGLAEGNINFPEDLRIVIADTFCQDYLNGE